MNFIVGLFAKYGSILLEKLVMSWINSAVAKYKEYLAKKEQEKIDQVNLETYKKAIDGKNENEISESAENFLNGNKP